MRLNERRKDVKVGLSGCPLSIKGGDLSYMVEELMDNAFKFSRQGTPVTVHLEKDGRLIITDEGRGMTSDEMAHIGAFQQFDRKKYEQQGLGLGLNLVQKLCEQCQAGFTLESRPGHGTRVQIAFAHDLMHPLATGEGNLSIPVLANALEC